MSKFTVVSIPVRKHTKQFLMMEFGKDNDPVIYLHQNNLLGKAVVLGLQKEPYRQNKPKEAAAHRAELQVALPSALKHHTMGKKERKELGELLDKMFQYCMIFFIKGQLLITQNERHAIRTFLDKYEIDPDSYDEETARKSWRDYKDRILKANRQLESEMEIAA